MKKRNRKPNGERERLRGAYPDWMVDYVFAPYVDEAGWTAWLAKCLVISGVLVFFLADFVPQVPRPVGYLELALGVILIALAVGIHMYRPKR